MAQLSILAGATSVSINLFVQDSSSTVGAGLGGIAPAGGSLLTGTKAYYSFSGTNAASTAISLAVLATVGAAWSSAGIVTLDDTNMKGVIRLDLPNAVLAASKGRSVTVYLYGGTNMAPCVTTIELTGWDNQDSVRGGLSALPSATPGTNSGLPLLNANLQVTALVNAYSAGQDSAVRRGTAQAGAAGSITLDSGASATDQTYQWELVSILGGTGPGQTRLITNYVGSTKVATVVPNWTTNPDLSSLFAIVPWGRANVGYWLESLVTAATAGIPDVNGKNIANVAAALDANNLLKVDVEDWKAGAVPAVNVTGVPLVDLKYTLGTLSPATAGSVAPDWGQVQNKTATVGLTNTTVGTITTYTGDTPQTGDCFARLGAPAGASIAADLAEIEAETDGIAAIPTNNGTNQTGDTFGLLTGANTELAAVPASTGTLVQMIKWLFLLARNKITQNSTTTLVRNDGDSATVGTSTISDDGTTFTRGKFT